MRLRRPWMRKGGMGMKKHVMAGLALALGAPVLTAGAFADDVKDEVRQALGRIEAQTKSTQGQVGDPATGLAAVRSAVDGVGTVAKQVGKDVNGGTQQVLSAVDATRTA